jgi:hypothetical protein
VSTLPLQQRVKNHHHYKGFLQRTQTITPNVDYGKKSTMKQNKQSRGNNAQLFIKLEDTQ